MPPKPIRELRNLTRYRKAQIQDRAREVNRLHKALEDAGIKLDCVATDILGKSSRDMLDALVAGTTDPAALANLARRQLRKKIPALTEALAGRFDSHHALWIGSILAHIDFLDEQIDRLSGRSRLSFRRSVLACQELDEYLGAHASLRTPLLARGHILPFWVLDIAEIDAIPDVDRVPHSLLRACQLGVKHVFRCAQYRAPCVLLKPQSSSKPSLGNTRNTNARPAIVSLRHRLSSGRPCTF